MRSFSDITYGKLGHPLQKLDIYLPDSDGSAPVFVYFHGGGIERGDKATPKCLAVAESATKRGIAFVSANYRLFPDAKYPDFIEDAAEVVGWVFKNIDKYCKTDGIYVGGSSAGGYISMMLCFDNRWLEKYGISPLDVRGFIHDAGQPTAHFNVLKYKGIDPRRVIIDETAPVYHIGTHEKYPPMLFLVSDHDMEGRYEQTMLTVATLKHFGHSEPNVKLCFMPNTKHCNYGEDERGEPVFANLVCEFIKEHK